MRCAILIATSDHIWRIQEYVTDAKMGPNCNIFCSLIDISWGANAELQIGIAKVLVLFDNFSICRTISPRKFFYVTSFVLNKIAKKHVRRNLKLCDTSEVGS
jgi:hypothetical protein